mmetsp:Transcript_9553/g.22759  ORF Transcript_9553/g.22759 Transcript_9553/m.22759 type:complete len:205 (+) Transcript_9553:457-1071(+)
MSVTVKSYSERRLAASPKSSCWNAAPAVTNCAIQSSCSALLAQHKMSRSVADTDTPKQYESVAQSGQSDTSSFVHLSNTFCGFVASSLSNTSRRASSITSTTNTDLNFSFLPPLRICSTPDFDAHLSDCAAAVSSWSVASSTRKRKKRYASVNAWSSATWWMALRRTRRRPMSVASSRVRASPLATSRSTSSDATKHRLYVRSR